MNDVAPNEPWTLLRRSTPARVGLGRAGTSLPTAELLALRTDHLRAREAVVAEFDQGALVADLEARGVEVVIAATTAVDRSDYLRHPGRGRRLDDRSRATLTALRRSGSPWDVALIVSDGLSHQAAARNAGQVVATTLECLPEHLDVAPVVVVPRARVGVLDDVGASLAARLAVILLGERPGLSAIDGLSAYLGFAPRPGRTDADRNCISNIRPAGGLALTAAGQRLAQLIVMSLDQGRSGTGLKVEFGNQSFGRSSIGT